jgi:predicted nucleic acid-binding protein
MSGDRVTYLDSSAIVKLVAREPESASLRRFLRRRVLVSSALAKAEVARSMIHVGEVGLRRAEQVIAGMDLVRVNDRVLVQAGRLEPTTLRTLDAIHLATAALFGGTLACLVSYDARMVAAAESMGWKVRHPA